MWKGRLLITAILFATGCAESVNLGRAPLNLPTPPQLHMQPVKWVVIPQDETAAAGSPTRNGVVIGMSEDGYKNLAQNFREILNYMAIQRKIIESYKGYYEHQP